MHARRGDIGRPWHSWQHPVPFKKNGVEKVSTRHAESVRYIGSSRPPKPTLHESRRRAKA